MPKENMRKSHDKTKIVRTNLDSVSIRHRRSDTTTPLIGKSVIERSSGKEATRLLKVDPTGIETTSLERRRARRKRRRIPVGGVSLLVPNNREGGDRKLDKDSGKICAECRGTSVRNQCGQVEPLQLCKGDCGVSLHPSCLARKCGPLTVLLPLGYRWFCQDCKTCSTIPSCSVTGRMTYLLNCDTCERGFHLQCLQPALAADKPKSVWRCLFCREHAISSKVEPFGGNRVDGNRSSLKIKVSISISHNRENRNTVNNENTNKLDSGEKLNNCKDTVKKEEIGRGNFIVPLDMMPNSYDKPRTVQTEANSLSSTISRHRRPAIISVIETTVIQHSSGRKSRLLKVDSNAIETTTLLLPRTGEKRKRLLTEDNDKTIKKKKTGKPSILGSMYVREVMVDGQVTSIPYLKKERGGKPSISGSMYLLGVKKDDNVPLSLSRVSAKKRKRSLSEANDQKLKKEKFDTPSVVGSTYQRDVTDDALANMSHHVAANGAVNDDFKLRKGEKPRPNNRKIIKARIRCPDKIQLGKFEINTSYSCSFPQAEDSATKLMFCEYCLIYTKCQSVLERHMRCCNWRQPPGIEIYRSGNNSVFEVDGNVDTIYCQTLCRIGKLFLKLKTLVQDVEQFSFYILTENDDFGCHLVGYFSKLKCSEKNNLSCIVIMPQYRRKGYGRTLIELSYLLSKIKRKPGTPEKPLSDLGQLAYNAYWKDVLLKYLDTQREVGNIRIDYMISETGLIRKDIIHTLELLNMVIEVYKEVTICIDFDIVDAHLKRKTTTKQIHIEPNRLRWTPPA